MKMYKNARNRASVARHLREIAVLCVLTLKTINRARTQHKTLRSNSIVRHGKVVRFHFIQTFRTGTPCLANNPVHATHYNITRPLGTPLTRAAEITFRSVTCFLLVSHNPRPATQEREIVDRKRCVLACHSSDRPCGAAAKCAAAGGGETPALWPLPSKPVTGRRQPQAHMPQRAPAPGIPVALPM